MTLAVGALSFSWFCHTTDLVVYRHAIQTTETKPGQGSELARGKPVGYLQAQLKVLKLGTAVKQIHDVLRVGFEPEASATLPPHNVIKCIFARILSMELPLENL